MVMFWIFWASVLTVFYTFFGYPLLLCVLTRFYSRRIRKAPITPSVSLLIAACNEEKTLPRKLQNMIKGLDYPADRLEFVIVSDGSTDATNSILANKPDPRMKAVLLEQRAGKARALHEGLKHVTGDVVIFTDARQLFEPQAIRRLVQNFADPSVGCVSGHLMLGRLGQPHAISGEGLKWKIENNIRNWEGQLDSVVGALGAFYGARRSLVLPPPEGTILDDLYIPLNAIRQGARTVFEPEARAWDDVRPNRSQEFRRKVRTLTGNYQLIRLCPWLLTTQNRILFQFVSHKLLRLVAPFALIAALVSSGMLNGPLYRLAFVFQSLFYFTALFGFYKRRGAIGQLAEIASTVVILNSAAVVALLNFWKGKEDVWINRTELTAGIEAVASPARAVMKPAVRK